MYLRVTLGAYDCSSYNGGSSKWAWVSRVGHALIDNVTLEIGGTQIDKQYGDWLNVWYELARNWAQDRGYDKLIGNTAELTTLAQSHSAASLWIPLKFFSNRHDGLAIPLIALQYHETKIYFEFRPNDECVNVMNTIDMSQIKMQDASLYVDYIYLDAEERKRFAQAQHEYLIEQLQFGGQESVNSVNQKFRLNFNHPCKALYWNTVMSRYTSGDPFLAYNPNNLNESLVLATKRWVLAVAKYDEDNSLDLSCNALQVASELANVNVAPLTPQVSGGNTYETYGSLFAKINPVALNESPTFDNVTVLGILLPVNVYSTPTTTLFPSNVSGWSRPTIGDGSSQGAGGLAGVGDVKLYQWDNYALFLDKTGNPVTKVLLTLNGHDRFSERDGQYFNFVQPYQCHSNTPCDGLNMYSFALNPEDHQPSGTCNFSRIDNATLSLQFGDSSLQSNQFNTQYLLDGANISKLNLNWSNLFN